MIEKNVRRILSELPKGVTLLAATKGRNIDEIKRAIDAGVRVIGENYVQEAYKKYSALSSDIEWHFIGHLQRNKVKRACEIFDMIETIDSENIAMELSKRCTAHGKKMNVLIEINSGKEPNKSGVVPEHALELAEKILELDGLNLEGVMTMGPVVDSVEQIRPYFKLTYEIYSTLREEFGANIHYLSMGMTDTWKIAVEEGANIIRVGRGIFGPR